MIIQGKGPDNKICLYKATLMTWQASIVYAICYMVDTKQIAYTYTSGGMPIVPEM